ncbi:unnamed protein product [Callosobruchus maculatus]|uniref:Uncharacterized protein n=1 Tax=Callosobruchus maculatus TaxID=64391 RepID=A0A653D6U6_CALMS|nr:unnamed protein product [Callosobruchus maculatus]
MVYNHTVHICNSYLKPTTFLNQTERNIYCYCSVIQHDHDSFLADVIIFQGIRIIYKYT